MDHEYEELEALWRETKTSSTTYRRVGDGLLLVGLKHRKRKLSSKVSDRTDYDFARIFQGLVEEAQQIMLTDSEDNQIILGQLQASTSDYYLEFGAVPLFWWPIDLDLVKDILFHDTQIITLYNPAHLADKLRNNGFEVKSRDGQMGLEVSKKVGEGNLQFGGFDHFIGMMSRQLWSEESIVQSLVNIVEQVENLGVSVPTKIEFHIQQGFR